MRALQTPRKAQLHEALLSWGACGIRIALCLALVLPLLLGLALLADQVIPAARVDIGVSYSPRYATAFGLDAWSVYLNLLDELNVRTVRLPMYWDELEPAPGRFDFSTLDAYLDAAASRRAGVLLVLGYKQPRWPECYAPAWAKELPPDLFQQRILNLVSAEVQHVRSYSNVIGWQVENEPLVHFGVCSFELLTPEFIAAEVGLVRELDTRPTILTDSGELSSWIPTLQLPADELGATVYRDLWFRSWGLWEHPVPAWSYMVRDHLARTLVGRPGTTLLSELQAEAWFDSMSLWDVQPEFEHRLFPPELVVTAHLEYAKRMQFRQVYLWGAEWWYWMRAQGYPDYVEAIEQETAGGAPPEGS
jgi:glycosyl hydrolase family 42 (putative beta-galactosidase)